jgi:hypothetical protein
MKPTEDQKKLDAARKAISEFRAIEDTFMYCRSRSTGTRNRYKAAAETLTEVETILNGSQEK